MRTITVLIPVYNAESTIVQTLESIEKQKTEEIDKIIIINDGSTDKTKELINDFKKKSKFNIELRENTKPSGLAHKYNNILHEITTKYLIIMHADIIIQEDTGIQIYYDVISKDDNTGIVVGTCKSSFEKRKQYNFRQKCEFDLNVYLTLTLKISNNAVPFGKFDIFNVDIVKKIGGFNEKRYFIAGEDGDLHSRLLKKNIKVVGCNITYIHVHSLEKTYSLKKFIHRAFRYSQTIGVRLRNHKDQRKHIFMLTKVAISGLLIAGIIISLLTHNQLLLIIGIFSWLLYVYKNTRLVIKYCYKDIKILSLPFIYLYIIFGGAYYIVQGFISNKQTI